MKKLLSATVLALVCLVLYEGALRVSKGQARGASLGFENQIRLENYAMAPDVRGEIVLVGSSVTQNLTTVGHTPGVWNLGISGGSPLTGCEAILHKGVNPKAVLIEQSIALAFPADDQLLKSPAKLRSLDKNGAPIALLLGRFLPGGSYVPPDDAPTHTLQDLHMEEFANDPKYKVTANDPKTQLAMRELEDFVTTMKAKGVPVYFFQIRPYGVLTRQTAFPAVQVEVDSLCNRGLAKQLPPEPAAESKTVDGIHLIRPEADQYLQVILRQVSQG